MITKEANCYLLKEADWLDDRIYDVKQGAKDLGYGITSGMKNLWHSGKGLLGLNSPIDEARHALGSAADAGAHVVDKGATAAEHYGKKLLDAIYGAGATAGKAISDAVSPLSDKVKNFANDSIRGYKDLYKYVTKDPDFMESITTVPRNMIERAREKRAIYSRHLKNEAAKHTQNAKDQADLANMLEPAANAYKQGVEAVQKAGKWLLEKATQKPTPRAEYQGLGDSWA